MIQHNHTRKIGGMLLCAACAMLTLHTFTLHTTSAGEIIPPTPLFAYVAPTEHEALASGMDEIERVFYKITLAEIKKDDTDGSILRKDGNGFVFAASNAFVRLFLKALIDRDKLSILTSPQVAGTIGTPIHFAVGYETSMQEMTLLPVRREDGKILTEIMVKRTEIIDGKEDTHQWEMTVNVPTTHQSSLVVARKLGDKAVILFITAWSHQETVPVAVEPPPRSRTTRTARSGITIQQPIRATFSVNTVATCPDSGAVLLEGIKRLSVAQVEGEH